MANEEQTEKVNRKKIYDYVQQLNPEIPMSAQDNFIIDIVIDECLAYCNRDDIPEDMERVVARIANKVWTNGLDAENVSSYRELDMQITYDIGANAFNEKTILQRWRKVLSI